MDMPRRKIHLTRFLWRTPAWRDLKHIQSIWLYSQEGMLSFEIEVDSKVDIPENYQIHARNSKNESKTNFIIIKNPKIIAKIGKNVKDLRVKGARKKAIYLGDLQYQEEEQTFSFPIYSTLADWYDFKGFSGEGLPHLKNQVQFT